MPSLLDDGFSKPQHLHQRFHALAQHASSPAVEVVKRAPIIQAASPVELAQRAASSNCADTGSGCETTSGSNVTLPIAIGIAVPVCVALVLFIYLQRRHTRRLRAEDANVNHRSLDFGFDPSVQNKKRKRDPQGKMAMTEVSDFEKSIRNQKGMSLDMDLNSPYMLPPEMHQSRESLHSLSRTLGDDVHDPYRPVAFSDKAGSIRASQRGADDAASTRTGGTDSTSRGFRQDNMNRNLLRNASRLSRSSPPEASSIVELSTPEHADAAARPTASPDVPSEPMQKAPSMSDFVLPAELGSGVEHSSAPQLNVVRQSNNYLASLIHSREASVEPQSARASLHASPIPMTPPASDRVASPPLHLQSPLALPSHSPLPQISIEQEFPGSGGLQYNEVVVPPAPDATSRTPRIQYPDHAMSREEHEYSADDYYDPAEEGAGNETTGNFLGAPAADGANNRLSIMRPLPPDDPRDTPEQRANRIRSFYKEYFSEGEAHAYAPNAAYYEDYGSEYLGDKPAIFDPASGQFIVAEAPFAAPVTRRAMTPPPRGPPRFQGRSRVNSQASNAGPMPPRSWAYSTVSANVGPRGRRPGPGPAQRLPPPKALHNLPTPHLLRDDKVAIFGAMDFAPPPRFKEQQAGRPASPFLDERPYSPSVPVASPLVSAFSELNPMPSPHLLRKSGTFTALDFAPPPRFKDRDTGSDAGSIRSGRSNYSAMSAAQVQNLRAGAYRLSRIPKQLVGSRAEFADSLKPTWHVGS